MKKKISLGGVMLYMIIIAFILVPSAVYMPWSRFGIGEIVYVIASVTLIYGALYNGRIGASLGRRL